MPWELSFLALVWNESTGDYSYKKHFPANVALWTPPGVFYQWNNAIRLGEVAVEDAKLVLPSCIFPVLPTTSDPPEIEIFPLKCTHGLFFCLFVSRRSWTTERGLHHLPECEARIFIDLTGTIAFMFLREIARRTIMCKEILYHYK